MTFHSVTSGFNGTAGLPPKAHPMYIMLIIAHTVAGLLAFAYGCAVLRPPVDVSGLRFRVYFWSLVALVVFLVAAISSHWSDLATTPRFIYVALTGLGLFMAWQAWRARSIPFQGERYVESVGFTLIALFDGFVIVSAIDLSAPVWLVLGVAVAGVLIGRWGVERVKASLSIATERDSATPGAICIGSAPNGG